MDRVKIYSKYDLTTNMNINNIINFTNNFNYEIEEYNINDVLEYFNIIKFSAIGKKSSDRRNKSVYAGSRHLLLRKTRDAKAQILCGNIIHRAVAAKRFFKVRKIIFVGNNRIF